MKRISSVIIFIGTVFPGICFAALPAISGNAPFEAMETAAFDLMGMVLLMIVFIWTAFNVMAKFNAAREGKGDFSSMGFSVIAGMIPLVLVGFFLTPSEKDNVAESIQVLPEITESSVDSGHLFAVFVIVFIIAGVITYLVNREDLVLQNEKKSEIDKIDRRFYQLKNKSKKLAERCNKENITGLSFTTLSTVSDELIALLQNNKSYLDSRKVNKFLHSSLDIYLDFLDEYEAIMGHFDEAKRNITEEGVLDMISAVKEVSQSIIDDRFLGIDVKASVIRQIND